MDNESKRIKEQRDSTSGNMKDQGDTTFKDEALNPTSEAMQTGPKNTEKSREKTGENKAVRNPTSYEAEFGSKKAGPGGYGDRAQKPLTDRKIDEDKNVRNSNQEKKDKEYQEEATEKEPNKSRVTKETKKHGDKDRTRDKEWEL